VADERALMASKIALVRAGQLTGDLDRVLSEPDKVTTSAERALNKSAASIETLRTTAEISAAEGRPSGARTLVSSNFCKTAIFPRLHSNVRGARRCGPPRRAVGTLSDCSRLIGEQSSNTCGGFEQDGTLRVP
jgi:hypothetical protein